MTKPDPNKLRLLVILLIVLGATVFFGYRINRAPNPVVVQAQEPKPSAASPVQSDARLRLDLLNKPDSGDEAGKKNLFQYGPAPAPPGPPKASSTIKPPAGESAGASTPSGPAGARPPTPPPPPPIPLKYIGFAYVESNSKALIATMLDDAQHLFTGVEGDVFMGRYRILQITDTSVQVEDLEFNRRQTLPLLKQ